MSETTPQGGVVVPIDVRQDGPTIAMFTRLELPSGRVVTVEVDTGSAVLILDEGLMPECDVATDDARLDERRGVDETGNPYTRRFITIDGSVRIVGEPCTIQQAPRVMFQKIIYDGLLGSDFLNRFRYSFDVRRKRLVLDSLDVDP